MTDAPRRFRSTGPEGLDRGSFPMRLFQKAKKLGTWDPMEIDLSRDREDWRELGDDERDILLRLTALFQAGEEAVTLDLIPLMRVLAAEGRLEEEIYLTSFLWEEAKHVEAFRRFFDEVAPDHGDLSRFATPAYRTVFEEELPRALNALDDDPSPEAQARASVTYNMIVEGILAETGYQAYHACLHRNGILPGMREMVRLVKRDESRHLAFGIYLLSRLVAEHGEELWTEVEAQMARLLEPALTIVSEIFDLYDPMPFDLTLDEFTGFAVSQFQSRMSRLESARESGLDEILRGSPPEEEA